MGLYHGGDHTLAQAVGKECPPLEAPRGGDAGYPFLLSDREPGHLDAEIRVGRRSRSLDSVHEVTVGSNRMVLLAGLESVGSAMQSDVSMMAVAAGLFHGLPESPQDV